MRVLLVEDNDEHAELIKFTLTSLVSNVERVVNGEEAVARLTGDTAASLDLVLLDINMPRMSGIEVLQHVKKTEAGRRVPIVMLTTSGSPTDRFLAYHHHANGYVVKPMDFAELEEMLTDLVNYWGKWNKRPEDPAVSPAVGG